MSRRPSWLWLALAVVLTPGVGASLLPGWTVEPRTDAYGDPLPPGALARLGSVRFRQGNFVLAVAFSPDGNTLAVATAGVGAHTLRLLDATTGKELLRFPPPKYGVSHLVFSADGKMLVGASAYDVHFWDAGTGAKRRHFPAHEGGIGALALSRDGKTIAVSGGTSQGGRRHTVRLLDAATGKQLRELVGHEVCANWLGFSADGNRLASSSPPLHYQESAGRIRVIPGVIFFWDVAAGKSLRRLESRSSQTVISPDHKTLALRHDWHADGSTILQDVESGKEIARCKGDHYEYFLFSPDGKTLATAGHSGRLRFWDAATGKERHQPGNDTSARVSLKAFSPDGRRLACVGDEPPDNALVRVWDVATGNEIRPPGGHRAGLTCLAAAPDGATVVTGSKDGTVRLWQASTGKELRRFEGHAGTVAAVCFAPDGKSVASGGEDKTVRLWATATGEEPRRLEGHQAALVSVAFAPDGKTLLTASADGVLKLHGWPPVGLGGKDARLVGPGWTSLASACFSPDGQHVARCGRNQAGEAALQVVHADSAKEVWTVRHERPPEDPTKPFRHSTSLVYWAVAFSGDGRLLASSECTLRERTGSLSGSVIRLWEVATGKEILIGGGPHVVTALAFSPDGRTLASGHGNERDRVYYPTSDPFAGAAAPGDEPTIFFWDVTTGKELDRRRGHLGWTTAVAFSPQGKRLVSAGADHTGLVWDVPHLAARKVSVEAVTPAALEKLWADLAGDAAGAHRAVARLSAAPGQAMPLLRQRLRPVPPVEAHRLAKLLGDLDSGRFAVREKAAAELEKLRELAVPGLRRARAENLSLESRRRLDLLLHKAEALLPSGEALRALRALAVLERIDNDDARGVLRVLAAGAPEARLTQETQASLQRLGRRPHRSH